MSGADDDGRLAGRTEEIRARLSAIRERIDAAAASAGRRGEEVRIVAVTKKLPADEVRAAYAAGHRDFGENYVQEGLAKIAELAAEMPAARWHLIGKLQSNKAAQALAGFTTLHGIDSLSTVAALSRTATRENRMAEVLMQVRLGAAAGGGGSTESGGGAKTARAGIDPAAAAAFLEEAGRHGGVRFVGLMGVADPDSPARPQFAALRELATGLAALGLDHAPLGELSMGMTGDFEEAVAEGATLVRIGTAIFGERPRG
ncbi:MAG: YggS family pyridoxal phosphate-dependent enzyme [Candidatus Binatia bacterium]